MVKNGGDPFGGGGARNAFEDVYPELFSNQPADRAARSLGQVPAMGDVIYVPTSLSFLRGKDDFIGGRAHVINVEIGQSGGGVHYVTIAERPNIRYKWESYLTQLQSKLKEEFGDQRAYPNPDFRPEFNES